MNFVEGQEVQCCNCKESFVFNAADLEVGFIDGKLEHYLICPKCGQKVCSDYSVTFNGSTPQREPRSEFEANLQADKFHWF